MKQYLVIYLLICTFAIPATAKPTHMKAEVVKQFIEAINAHDLEKIGALMTENHTFIDAENKHFNGKEAMLPAWKAYLEMFPDYTIETEKIFTDKDTIAVFGHASGTYHNRKEDSSKARWRIPASWKAVVSKGRISVWQVYADSRIPLEIINRYAKPAGDANKVQGLGGAFFKAKDAKTLCAWYDKHLGTTFGKNQYQLFQWRNRNNKEHIGTTTFGVFKETTDYFGRAENRFMFNLRVNNLDAFLERLKSEGVEVLEKTESFEYGKFGWIVDPEGNRIELWEPMNEYLFDQE